MTTLQIKQLDSFIESNFSNLPLWSYDDECIYVIIVTTSDSSGTNKILKIGQAPKGMMARCQGLRKWFIEHDIFEMNIIAIIKPEDALLRIEKNIHTELRKLNMNVHLKSHFESRGSQETYSFTPVVLTALCKLIRAIPNTCWMNDSMKKFNMEIKLELY